MSDNKKNIELLDLLIEYGKMILPDDFIFTTITLNKNLKCKPHKDRGNFGISALVCIGSYDKGGIFIWGSAPIDGERGDPVLHSTNNTILMFEGSKLLHETEQFTGDRYAIIYFSQNKKYIPDEYIYKGTQKY